MQILDTKKGDSWATIRIELEVFELLEEGKLELTDRWRAAGKSLARIENVEWPLIQIDVLTRDYDPYYRKYSQEFNFYFKQEREG